jgi:hypothetical protein
MAQAGQVNPLVSSMNGQIIPIQSVAAAHFATCGSLFNLEIP